MAIHSIIRLVFFLNLSIYSVISSNKPNIVLFLTDDQDFVLGGMTPMKNVDKLLAKKGSTFINSFVAAPICCPSRASILTGTYVHNHNTRNNSLSGGCSDKKWQQEHEPKTFAAILQNEAKYSTFYAGKYLNQYGDKDAGGIEHVPQGWNVWRGLKGNSKYFNFTLSHDGVPKNYNNNEYLTDVLKTEALNFIETEYKNKLNNPLLLVISPPAAHSPFTPAPRHENAFKWLQALRTPNFNIPAGDDKHWLLRMNPSPLPNSTVDKLDLIFRSRWETLLSVDELVEAVVKRLESLNMANDTYFIFTSDNGYHIGQFSQPFDKRQPYESDIRVPLVVRGPTVEKNAYKYYPTVNIDLAPTILRIAGINQPAYMDGIPLPIFGDGRNEFDEFSLETNDVNGHEMYDRQILIEYHGESSTQISADCPWSSDLNVSNCLPDYSCKCQDAKNNTFSCARHLHPAINFIYCAFNDTQGFEEAYDLIGDPFQLKNSINEMMPAIKFKYQSTLEYLSNCKGANCNYFDEFY